jgi:hypothetical protein
LPEISSAQAKQFPVLVEDAAGAIASVDVKLDGGARIGDG